MTGGTQNICSGLFAAGDDQIWIASRDQGLMLFNKETGTFRNVRNPKNPDEVIGVFNCHQSDNNTIWMADQKKLYRFDLDTARLTWHPVLSASRDEHITGGVYSFLALKNKLFCGIYYDGNFGWIDRTTNRFISRPLTSASDNEGVRHLSADNNNTVWVGTATGTYLYDPQADKLITPKKIQNRDYYFKAPCTDVWHNDDGSHWIATAKGIVLYDPIQSRLLVLDTTQPLNHRLQVQHITDVFKDSKGRLWFGELGSGIGCYLPARDSVIHFSKDLLPWRGNSTGFCEDKNGSIIFSMQSNGVIIIEKPFTPQQKLTLCNTGNYLPTDHINYIFADNKGRIWLYTSNGLLLFDPISKSYTAFKSKQGIYDDYIDSYPYQDSAGRMYIGFGVGYQTFLPDSLLAPRPSKLTIRLHDLSVNGNQWPQHPAYISDLSLDPNPGNVSFSFAAMGLPASDGCGYAYLLEGYDKDWHYTTTTSGQYNNLPPGGYTLRIKASTLNGQWDSEPFSIRLTVIPAWYQSIWFKVLLGALVAATLLGFFSYRLRQVRKEAALKAGFQKKINELEMRSLRAQMNPHFIFNSLSSINRYIVKSDHRTASNYLTKFSKLIRMILDNSALDVISVEKELQTLQLYIDMEELRFDHAFTYKIEVDDAIDEEETYIPSMLLQPYVENAIWHGLMHKEEGGGILLIKLVLLSPTLLMACIEDNGVGREKAIALKSKEALKKKSYGMQISHDRLELLNRQKQESPGVVIEDVINDEGTVNGTRVILHIPIQNKQH